ncbi:ABC-type multidrug transport system, permease component [Sphaerochaeta pleomorpha str. Grapes]|uniref:ABC-type multidrug transport system, permease component n=1 Tax=Sphaerochaeta pleomorpha (strain ATCC BAA-1885 / DSM 22778 / Grapes) TaxID=158190 RepID=G8QX71_SPHPG|nr:ABC transporter permease [Sphaerochaeta pleomorpha]AEV30656.1 ABC-type multidrug transport system, permease component [Sphaerochaeta pleomorpha str. Grapes]
MLKYLIQKEFIQIRRNLFLPRMILIYPIMLILVLPFAANYEIKNINIAVVDHDDSMLSTRLRAKISSSHYFRISGYCYNDLDALRMVELGTADIVLEISPGFGNELVRGNQGAVLISSDTVNGTKGNLGSAYLSLVMQDFSTELRNEAVPALKNSPQSVTLEPHYLYNPYLSYPDFMIPALMVMGLLLITGFLPALNIVGEKEAGTIESMHVTPVRKRTFILSKLIPYWIIGFFVFTFMLLLALVFWKLFPTGSILLLYLSACLFVLTVSGFGLVISNYARSYQQAMFMMFFFIMIFNFLSGLFTPVSSMPQWAQVFSHLSPLRYMIEILRGVYLRVCGIQDLHKQLISLAILMVGFNSWAIISYRKKS